MKFTRGQTEKFLAQFYLDYDAGIVAPITGATIKCLFKYDPRDLDGASGVVTKQTGGSGVVITDGPNGICEVTVAAADFNNVQVNKLYMECVAKLIDGSYLRGDGIQEVEILGNVVKTLF